jgi:DNA-binding response OmpR family regulator
MKLLLVEDEPDLLASVVSYLQAQQYVCEVATTYAQAQEKMLLYSYECIVLDLTLPGGDGLNLLRELQQQQRGAGVIITSARAGVDDRITGLELGADDYLAKPFYLPELSARIAALVRRRHYQGTNLLVVGLLSVDVPARRATVAGRPTRAASSQKAR